MAAEELFGGMSSRGHWEAGGARRRQVLDERSDIRDAGNGGRVRSAAVAELSRTKPSEQSSAAEVPSPELQEGDAKKQERKSTFTSR